MIYTIDYIKDAQGNDYLGVKIPNGILYPFLNELKELVGEQNFSELINNKQKRDGNLFHITLISVPEINSIRKKISRDKFNKILSSVLEQEINDIKLQGLGKAVKNNDKAYFVVCHSNQLNSLRKKFSLPNKDLHITLGFDRKDVHGVPKNSLINSEANLHESVPAYGMFDRPGPTVSGDNKTVKPEYPISPVTAIPHVANQLSEEQPPIDDEEYTPNTKDDLSRAVAALAKRLPREEIQKFYNIVRRYVMKYNDKFETEQAVDFLNKGKTDRITEAIVYKFLVNKLIKQNENLYENNDVANHLFKKNTKKKI